MNTTTQAIIALLPKKPLLAPADIAAAYGLAGSTAIIADIKVGNTLVTSLNCNDITNSDLVSGHIYFTPATNTLTLNGATLDTYDGISINTNNGDMPIENPVIELIGENDVLGGIDLDNDVSEEYTGLLMITGSGSLSLTITYSDAIVNERAII